MLMQTIKIILFSVLGLMISAAVCAQTDFALDDELGAELRFLQAEMFVITASKVLERVDKTVSTITVITAEQIQNMGARTLLDVLPVVPGISITQDGFGQGVIEVRGTKTRPSEKVLLMLNGHPLDHNLTNGTSTNAFDDIMMENVKRIEIVRGPGSALYGANAFLGIINVLTKEAEDIDGVTVSVDAGSFDTHRYHLMAGKRLGKLAVVANLNYSDTDGINEWIKGGPSAIVQTPVRTNLWKKKRDFELRLRYGGWSLEGRSVRQETGTFAGFFGRESLTGSERDYEDNFLVLGYKHKFNDNFSAEVKLFRDYFHFDNILQAGLTSFIKPTVTNTRTGGEVQGVYRFNKAHQLVFGAMSEKKKQFDIPKQFSVTASKDLWGVYLQDIWDVSDTLRVVMGARFDDFSDFGETFNPRIGLSWEWLPGYILKMSYGTAFRAPAFAETLNTSSLLLGDPNLQPEIVETIELGLAARFTEALSGQIQLFHTKGEDIIAQISVPGGTVHANASGGTSEGIETEMKYRFGNGTYLALNYTYQDPKSDDGGRLPDIARHHGTVMANYEFSDRINLHADWILKGNTSRAENDGRGDIPGYGTVNTTLRLQNMWRGWEFQLSVINLLDKKTVDPAPTRIPDDYPRPHRSFFAKAIYHF